MFSPQAHLPFSAQALLTHCPLGWEHRDIKIFILFDERGSGKSQSIHPSPPPLVLSNKLLAERRENEEGENPKIKTENQPVSSYPWLPTSFMVAQAWGVARHMIEEVNWAVSSQGGVHGYVDDGTEKRCPSPPQGGRDCVRWGRRWRLTEVSQHQLPVGDSPRSHCLYTEDFAHPWIHNHQFSEHSESEKPKVTSVFKCWKHNYILNTLCCLSSLLSFVLKRICSISVSYWYRYRFRYEYVKV